MVAARPLAPTLLTAALLFALLAFACGGGAGQRAPATPVTPVNGVITMRAYEWGFDPPAVLLQPGEQVRLVLSNDGQVLHDLKVDGLQAQVINIQDNGPLSGGEGEVFLSAEPGHEASITFVAQEAGSFTFYCTIQPHRRLGMEGDLIVQ